MLDVSPIAAFQDNYIWLIRGALDPREVAVVDPGDAGPVQAALAAEGLRLAAILATHHHADHVAGERARLPALGLEFGVLDVPGHTAGHIAFYGHGALFCGDTMFSAGCGRLFEGTPEQMLASLDALASLPAETRVFCGHEYTLANLRFAREVESGNADIADYVQKASVLRASGRPTLPSTIGLEKRVNPFLRSRHENVKLSAERRAGRVLSTPVAVFAEVRSWKDTFR
jgi:hydroxyacylglutathione hydrolase